MTLKSDAKFKGKLIRGLKNDIGNLVNFHTSSQKFENLHFGGLLLPKVCNVWAKNLQRSYVPWHWIVIQYLKKKWHVVWKIILRNFVNFHASSRKSKNLHFDGLVSSKVYNVLDEKYRRVMSRDTEEWSREKLILKKYAFFVWCNRLEAVSGRYS